MLSLQYQAGLEQRSSMGDLGAFVPTVPLSSPFLNSLRPSTCERPHAASVPRRHRTTCIVQAPNRTESKRDASAVIRRGERRPAKAPELHVTGDSVEASPSEIAQVALFGGLTLVELIHIMASVEGPADSVGVLVALVAGWLFADLGTAIYHWAVDNYGTKDTPVFGFQIEAFQGHHKSPWTITKRDFSNNLYRLTKPTSPQMALLIFAPLSPIVAAGLCSALFWIVASQELHRQAHMTRPSSYAKFLQDFGIALSRKEHGLHHSSPFDGHYGIVSGIVNPLLDGSKFFRRMEAFVYRLNGVQPISWNLDPKLKDEALKL